MSQLVLVGPNRYSGYTQAPLRDPILAVHKLCVLSDIRAALWVSTHILRSGTV